MSNSDASLEQDTSPIIFLDTNAVHFAQLLLAFLRRENLTPQEVSWEQIEPRVQHNEGQSAVDYYKNGYKIARYVQERSRAGAFIQYSPSTYLELMGGALRGKAILAAARVAVPQRWYNRLSESEVLFHLSTDAYTTSQTDILGIEQLFLEVAGTAVQQVRPDNIPGILTLANDILGLIFLDIGDCLVLASAMLGRAEEIITSDGYFQRIVTWLENPTASTQRHAQQFTGAREILIDKLSAYFGIEPREVVLPKAKRASKLP